MKKYIYRLLSDVVLDIITGRIGIDDIGLIFDPEKAIVDLESRQSSLDEIFDKICKSNFEYCYDNGSYVTTEQWGQITEKYQTRDAFLMECREILAELNSKEKIKSVPNGQYIDSVAHGIDTQKRLHTEDEFVKFIIDRVVRKLDGISDVSNINDVESFITYFKTFFPKHEKILTLLLAKIEKYRTVLGERSGSGETVNFETVDADKRFENVGEIRITNNLFEDEYAILIQNISRNYLKKIKTPEEASRVFSLVFGDGYSEEVLRRLPDSMGYGDTYSISLLRTGGLRDISCNIQYRLTGNSLFGVEKVAYVHRNEDGGLELIYKLRVNSGLMHSDRVSYLYGEKCKPDCFLTEISVGRIGEDRESGKKCFVGSKMAIENADRKISKMADEFFHLTNAEVLRTHKVRVAPKGTIPSAIVMDSVLKYLQENDIYDGVAQVWPSDGAYISIAQSDGKRIEIRCDIATELNKNMTCVVSLPDGSEVEFVLTRKENNKNISDSLCGIDDLNIVEVRSQGEHPLVSEIIKDLQLNFGARETTIEDIGSALREHALEVGNSEAAMEAFIDAAKVSDKRAEDLKKEAKGE